APETGKMFGSFSGRAPSKGMMARNYYRAGRDFYEQGQLDLAAENLRKASELAPESVEGSNAARLLSNLAVIHGQRDVTSTGEKAAAAEVQREVAARNWKLQQEQSTLLSGALEQARKGNVREAQSQLQAAQALNEQLLKQGADISEQQARVSGVSED